MRSCRRLPRTLLLPLSLTLSLTACDQTVKIVAGERDLSAKSTGDAGTGNPEIDAGSRREPDTREPQLIPTEGQDDDDAGSQKPPIDGELMACEQQMCPKDSLCKYDVCLPNLGDCADNDGCRGDSYCDADKICVPYGVDPAIINDPSCERADDPPSPIPTVQCIWDGAGSTLPAFDDIYTTPVVADFNLDGDPNKLQPSIVVSTRTGSAPGGERLGILRLIDGRTCSEQLLLGDLTDPMNPDRPGYASQLAIGDLNGDLDQGGRPEIVGLHRTPGPFGTYPPLQPIAWELVGDAGAVTLQTQWRGRICGGQNDDAPIMFGNGWLELGPALIDLDDDGAPEVVIDKYVFDNKGCLLNESVRSATVVQAAVNALYTPYLASGDNHKGAISTIADVDLDGQPELVRHDGVYQWLNGDWVLEAYASNWSLPAKKGGHVAIADLGNYSAAGVRPATDPLPEIIVVSAAGDFAPSSTGSVRVMTLDGTIIYGRDIPSKGIGCVGNECFGGHGGPPTASDFDGDGQVEFAAAANIYYAVYDPDCVAAGVPPQRPGGACNRTANPLPPAGQEDGILWAVESVDFSSSQTGSSIFDFDGNGQAEAVYRDEKLLRVYDGSTGTVIFSGPAASGTGSEYPVIADVDGDFATEIVYGGSTGVTILREPDDLWVSSRPIWNQHAYSITHVSDEGKVARTSEWLNNWEQKGLNNFRQNTQGKLGADSLADLTVELDKIKQLCTGATGLIPLYAKVCNRGTNPVQDGAQVAFFIGNAGRKLCETVTETLLDVGMCTIVECEATVPPGSDVTVIVDPEGKIPDCHPGNNDGSGSSVLCPVAR